MAKLWCTYALLVLGVWKSCGFRRQLAPEPPSGLDATVNLTLRHPALGEYLAGELENLRTEEERLLLLLLRDLRRLFRLRELALADFNSKFPPTYSQTSHKWVAAKAVVGSSLSLAGGAHLGDVWKTAISFGGRGFGYGNFALWIGKYVASLDESNRQLWRLGGDAKSDYWRDVPLGVIWESYEKVLRAERTYERIAPTVIESTYLRTSEDCHPELPETLGNLKEKGVPFEGKINRGDLVKTMEPFGSTNQDCIAIEIFNASLGRTRQYVKRWVPAKNIVANGWYITSNHSSSFPIRKEPGCNKLPRSEAQTRPRLFPGEVFTVIDWKVDQEGDGRVFKLGDGRGWVCTKENDVFIRMRGPAHKEEAQALRDMLALTLNPAARGEDVNTRVARINSAVTSPRASVLRFVTKAGLGIAVASGVGMLLLPAIVISVADSVGSASLQIASGASLTDKAAYVLATLAQYEKDLFDGKLPGHEKCDVVQKRLCPPMQTCLRSGAFQRAHGSRSHGFCVPAPLPLLPDNSTCLSHMDCESTYCKYDEIVTKKQSLNVEASLKGSCSSFVPKWRKVARALDVVNALKVGAPVAKPI